MIFVVVDTSLELFLLPEQADEPTAIRSAAAAELGLAEERITDVRIRKRSIDARHAPVRIRLVVDVYTDQAPPPEEPLHPHLTPVTGKRSAIIVGAGPAGMFAALRLIERGIRPILLERGKDVQTRRRDLAAIQRRGVVNPDSNYCFGEGGAGTYSDGKLYTRSTKRGNVTEVLNILVAHGASTDILIDAHPHIGSNRLPKVVAAIRETILNAGGEIRFDTRVVDLIIDHAGRIRGVVTAAGDEVIGEGVILATGHSARDIYTMLERKGITLEGKPFAVGVRIEHPQPLIDSIQYHTTERNPHLPAARYRLASTVRERGVYSFCMCPGGFIVPSATEDGEVVVNGMSLSRRDSPFANSGIIVGVEPEDFKAFVDRGPLAGMYYQQSLELEAFRAGGGAQRAPAQRLTDFVAGRTSSTLPPCSYNPGITSVPLHEILPEPMARRLQQGLKNFNSRMPGYMTEEAVLVAVESRTSSPVRIPRNPETLQHPDIAGLYPSGEGAGYAGGIVSAAIDGMRVADAAAERIMRS